MKKTLLFLGIFLSANLFGQNIIGTWQLIQSVPAVNVGPNPGSSQWYYSPPGDVNLKDCLYDDSLQFDANGNFTHFMDGSTWLNFPNNPSWQDPSLPEQCGSPVAPHDGGVFTYTYSNNQLTVYGNGAHLGHPHVINGGTLSDPSSAPSSLTYEISWTEFGDMNVDIWDGTAWWRFIYRRTNFCLNNSSSSTITQTVCDSYISPAGNIYTSSGIYFNTIPNYIGCDSIITIDLTVNNSSQTNYITQTVCEEYILNGQVYNSSGIYYQSLSNVLGCDSIVSLYLTVLNTFNTISETVCDSYISPSGNIYTSTGVYVDTIVNSAGCDSIITIDLTLIGNSTSSTISETVCDSYISPSGNIYTSTGVYVDTIVNSAGCDSIITLELTINPNDFDITFESSQQLFTAPPFAVAFSNTSPDLSNYTYTWYWGDGTSTSSNNATVFHEYLNNGLYTVTLEATNNSTGCTDQTTFTDYIYTTGGVSCTHMASILQSGPIDACDGQTVILTCNSDPNFTYQWRRNGVYISGNNNDSLYVTSTGSYAVIITENNCSVNSSEILVNFTPSIPTPIITSTGLIQSCVGGSVILDAGAGYDTYLWSTGGTSQTEEVTTSGDYTVTVSDLLGCSLTSNVFTVNASFMQPQQVCIVGIDSLSNFNRVVWEKPISDGIDYFNVYKEGSAANVYDLIGSVPYDDTAVFVDVNSNTAVQAYRYKVSIVDTCATESALGEFHKTIHLTINQGVGQTWNLIWNHYEGLSFPSYNIYRGTDPSNMSLLETIASNLNSYTDLDPPVGASIYYQIEVVNTNGCDPLKATDYSVSRSNIAAVGVVNNIELISGSINIFPNPTSNLMTIQSETELNNKFKIFDQQGREVMNGKLKGVSTEVSLGKLSRGTYTIQVDGNYKPAVIIKQ